jgi:uncharacterized glyoxalase superfamily protein PhnB
MQLVQSRVVTEDVEGMADFYASLIGVEVVLNDYYVEVPTGAMSVGFSRCRFTEFDSGSKTEGLPPPGTVVLDFLVEDVDGEFDRVNRLGVEWVLPPTTQPWGSRSMVLRDPEGNLVSVFSRRVLEDQ